MGGGVGEFSARFLQRSEGSWDGECSPRPQSTIDIIYVACNGTISFKIVEKMALHN